MAERYSDLVEIKYSIHKYSSYSTNYTPQSILIDKPNDKFSRWSSDSNEFPQYIILKLKEPAIVKTITFGKFEKSHVCNIKKFCVYGGLTDDNMILLLEGGLKNTTVSETFTLTHTVGNHEFPVRYIKIMPLQSWGSNFNFSIWYVQLKGCQDWTLVQKCMNWYTIYREKEAIRLCLKHFRRHNYIEAFESLAGESKVKLEDPFLTLLHNSLVKKGDFNHCECLMRQAASEGLFQEYICRLDYKPNWTPLFTASGTSGSQSPDRPGMRGGHQLCIDNSHQTVYLFGGWDGTKDLSDLWSYHIPNNQWTCISRDTRLQGGPSGRSCHKICIDPKRRELFTLGRYLDTKLRQPENLKSDFYLYDIENNKWTLISDDTAAVGGPQLMFDHQMAMDVDNRIIYVFGGKILTHSRWEGCTSSLSSSISSTSTFTPAEPLFSGLYSYHVSTNTWILLREDSSVTGPNKIKSRVGHSMLLHPGTRQLYVLGGQRHKEFLIDFFAYNIDTDSITYISDGSKKDPRSVPSAGFTQKATIDPNLNEIHVFAGLSKEKDRRDDNMRNCFWVYDITMNKWSCIYHNERIDETYWARMKNIEPCPRFAHQLVYDDANKVHYLFGGNPGKSDYPELRLDDFWSLRLSRPSVDQLLKSSIFQIRKTKFKELAYTDPVSALKYLQTTLSNEVDHHNTEQVEEFQRLASTLFQVSNLTTNSPAFIFNKDLLNQSERDSRQQQHFECSGFEKSEMSTDDDRSESSLSSSSLLNPLTKEQLCAWQHHLRSELFDRLTLLFPEGMTQPRSNLVDLVPY